MTNPQKEHMLPKISIIIPVYNAEAYLGDCLKSVINQTLKNIEIICINDGSRDNSLTILKQYEEIDKRITIITQENFGAYAARNNGIHHASGEYLLFVDADDFIEENLCSCVYDKAIETKADVILFGADLYDQKAGSFTAANWLFAKDYLPSKKVFNRDDVPESLFSIVAGGPCNKLYRRSMIIEKRIYFPNLPSIEDVPFVYTALAVAERISYVDLILEHYRRNAPSNGLVSKINDHPDRIFDSYRILKNRLEDFGLYKALERTFINRAASDFIDQYLYVIKADSSKQYFKMALSRIYAEEFGLKRRENDYFFRPFVFNNLQKILSDDLNFPMASEKDLAQPKLSVIIPVFNSEPFIRQCINSVLAQTFTSFELILVDDGSTDNSLQILNAYAKLDPRIHILTQQNQYAGVARNNGMRIARGEYLLFLDSDDYFAKTMLEELYFSAEKDNAEIVICDGYYHDNATGKTRPASLFLQQYNIPANIPFCYKDNPNKILHISIDCPWNKLFKKSFINRHELQFQPLRSANDVYFVDCALILANRITINRKRLVYYRTNVKTSLQATRSKQPLNFYEALSAVRTRLIHEARYSEIEKCLISLLIAGCRHHLNNAKDGDTYRFLYLFFKNTAFSEWDINVSNNTQFVYVDDRHWVESVLCCSPEEYLINRINHLSEELNSYKTKTQSLLKESALTCTPTDNALTGQVIKYYRSYKLGCAITWMPRMARGFFRCFKEHGVTYTTKRFLEHFGIPMGVEIERKPYGVTKHKRKQQIIISLTSFPARINTVHIAIETLLNQTMKPDRIILWLAENQFPQKDNILPVELQKQRKRGLEIRWCDDLKSHKKYYYVMQENPNAIIITVDDDLVYVPNMLELLYKAHLNNPLAVCTMRSHLIQFDEGGKILPYSQWEKEQTSLINIPSMELLSTSGAGTLYPPNCMAREVFDKDAFMESCLYADDIWLKIMQLMNGTPTVQVAVQQDIHLIDGTQQEALWYFNVDGGNNDKQLQNVALKYGINLTKMHFKNIKSAETARSNSLDH